MRRPSLDEIARHEADQASPKEIELGIGTLTWPSGERVSDRYGFVRLLTPGGQDVLQAHQLIALTGQRGHLEVEVLESRRSGHVGDLFRGIFPVQPLVGERFPLGEDGALAAMRELHGVVVGIRPDVDRESDWLEPTQLYRAIDQTVRLLFVPARAT